MTEETKSRSMYEQIRDEDHLYLDSECHLFFDWFCRDRSLLAKSKRLMTIVKRISWSKKVDITTSYIWFKNNCPMMGNLYDDIRISDIETGENLFVIIPSSGFDSDNGEAQLFSKENDFKEPVARGKLKDIYEYFGV